MADTRKHKEILEPNDDVEWYGSESNKRRRLETSTENEENITEDENTMVVDQAIENDNNFGHALVEDSIDEGNMILIEEEADEEEDSDDSDDYSDDDDDSDYYYSTDDSSYDSSNCSFFSDEPCCADSDSSELSDDSDSEDINFY